MRNKKRAFVFGAVLVVIVAVALAAGYYRPAIGYRSALIITLINIIGLPRGVLDLGVLDLNDIKSRRVDFLVDFYGFHYRGNTGNSIDAHIYYYGAYEKSELYFIRDTLTSLGHDAVLIDVGANTGMYSIFASKYARQVHAVEPYPPALVRLRSVIEENKIDNIRVHPVGLGASDSEQTFFPPPEDNLGYASFVPKFVQGGTGKQLKLRIVPADTYFSHLDRVDFIKMDIEGYEKQALAGMRQTLRRHRPVVLMELSVDSALPDLFKSLEELRAAFPENYGFLVFRAQDRISGAYQLRDFRPSFDRKAQYNIVARPNEKAEHIPLMFDGQK